MRKPSKKEMSAKRKALAVARKENRENIASLKKAGKSEFYISKLRDLGSDFANEIADLSEKLEG